MESFQALDEVDYTTFTSMESDHESNIDGYYWTKMGLRKEKGHNSRWKEPRDRSNWIRGAETPGEQLRVLLYDMKNDVKELLSVIETFFSRQILSEELEMKEDLMNYLLKEILVNI